MVSKSLFGFLTFASKMVASVLIITMGPLTAIVSTFNHFQISVLAEFCSDPLASKTHLVPLEDREEQTSFAQQDLGECLLVVGL